MIEAEFLVIGAGIAGASVASHLAEKSRVMLLEREPRPGYHSTGRSAALFSETYGNPVIRMLTRASRAFLFDPPADFTSDLLVRPRGSLFIATAAQLQAFDAFSALPDISPATRLLSLPDAHELCPALRGGTLAGALLEPESQDLDVAALHQAYLRMFRRRGGVGLNDQVVTALRYDGQRWHVSVGSETYAAPVVINAAGAWADEVAQLAGLSPLGLKAHRRTALLVDVGAEVDVSSWPMVIDIDEQFYFKPDAGRLLISPADETPVDPSDAQAEEWDVAVAIDRVEAATTLQCNRVTHRWAGLRTFAPDRAPVVGFGEQAGFFWLAGQGGYGIQTAPALARVAAALVQRESLPAELLGMGLREKDLSPARF